MSSTPDSELPPPSAAPAPAWAQRLLNAEQTWMHQHLAGFERLLWISPALGDGSTRASPNILHVVAHGSFLHGDLRSSSSEWPLRDDCVEAVVIQHPLEAGLRLEVLLDEAMRVLKPECSLWVLASGTASLGRFRLARALGEGVRWPSAFRYGAFQSSMAGHGGVDIEVKSLGFDAMSGTITVLSRSLPWAPVLLVHVRKRRVANILRPRALRSISNAGVAGLPALPASRVGLAA